MKKILLYPGLVLLAFTTPAFGVFAQSVREHLKLKGIISANTENEDNEVDPSFKELVAPEGFKKRIATGNQEQQVSTMENGLQIVKDIIDKMIAKEYGFSLLSQHKYMINNCLGFKVSAGQFMVKFYNPVIDVDNMGKITIKLGINKINLSALKIRMRPCTKIEHIPDPCHFGKKFEIGGEATDVSVTATIDPVARALDGSAGVCFFALDDNVMFKWHIGGLNLKPMQNNLDNLGKDMLEDGLNAGLFNVFYTQFIKYSKEVIPQYFKECEDAYNVNKKINKLPSGVSANDTGKANHSSTESAKWVITQDLALKGVLGRLDVNFPPEVDRNISIYRQEDLKFLTSVSKNVKTFTLAPGEYRMTLTTVPVENVPIQKGHETRLKAGFLNIVSEGGWSLYDESKKKFYTSGQSKKIVLPVGNYQLKLGQQYFPIEIKDGETIEM